MVPGLFSGALVFFVWMRVENPLILALGGEREITCSRPAAGVSKR